MSVRPPNVLTKAEIAERWGTTPSVVQKRLGKCDGRLPAPGVGSPFGYYELSRVEEYENGRPSGRKKRAVEQHRRARNLVVVTEAQLRTLYIEQDMTRAELAAYFGGVSTSTVKRWLYEWGIVKKGAKARKRKALRSPALIEFVDPEAGMTQIEKVSFRLGLRGAKLVHNKMTGRYEIAGRAYSIPALLELVGLDEIDVPERVLSFNSTPRLEGRFGKQVAA